MIKLRIQKPEARIGFFTLYSILFTVFCLLTSCGKKGDPILKSYEKPDPPSGLRAIHRESEIILSWEFPKDKEPSIKGFHLLKIIPPNFERIAFLEKDERSYIDTDFKIGSEYKYKIISQNLRGITSDSSNIISIVPKTLPSPPRKILFKVEYDSLILSWESVENEVLYNIYKSDRKGGYGLAPLNKEPVRETYFRDGFDIKRPVYYTIRSIRGGEARGEGPASEEIEINPWEFVPSPPGDLQAVVTEENVFLLWKEAPETWVVGYRVYREVDEKEGFIFIGKTQTPTFLDKERPLTKRNYRVTALGPSKEGPASEIRDVIFVPYR